MRIFLAQIQFVVYDVYVSFGYILLLNVELYRFSNNSASVDNNFQDTSDISLDFIAGVIVGNGSFSWVKQKGAEIPVFRIKINADERPLVEAIKKKLGLEEAIYEYTHAKCHYVLILVRHRSTIEDIIIPAFEARLFGMKRKQFEAWRDRFYQKKLDLFQKHRIWREQKRSQGNF